MPTLRFAAVVLLTPWIAACAQARSAPIAAPTADATRTVSEEKAAARPHATMLRYPDVGRTHIVFGYADDLWIVDRNGGPASPLASPPGQETFPKFSADDQTIAFVGNYDGNRDLYTIPVSGGVPTRVTYHPASETLCDWTPDGDLLFFSNALAGLARQTQLLTISPHGGLPKKLPPPYGANGAISSDGQWLAYTPHSRDRRTWKRYRGGMATDVWLFNLATNEAKKITDWEGTDSLPMWFGDTVYYLSDAGRAHRLNIWSYDTRSGRRKQVTRFTEYDVKWPSIGPGDHDQGEIVFQNGPKLYLLDLGTETSREVSVSVPGDRPTIRPHSVDASEFVLNWNVSPTGKRAVVEARGDIWSVPAKHGSPRHLTRTSGVAERDPSWSPDGRWVAYFSDQTGEYELYITQSDGKGETRRLTNDGKVFRFSPVWSPDSKRITFWDKTGALYLHTIDGGETRLVDTDPSAGRSRVSWSHDSAWLAYAKNGDNNMSSVWLYDVAGAATHQVTGGMFNDTWPVFDRKGDYLFFASNRDFSSPAYEDIGQSFIYADTDVLVVVPLREEVGSPWAPESDEETWEDEDKEDADKPANAAGDKSESPKDKKNDEAKKDKKNDGSDKKDPSTKKKGNGKKDDEPLVVELDGLERRALRIGVKRGSFSGLSVTHDGKLVYVRAPRRGSEGEPSIKILDLDSIKKEKSEKKREKTIVSGVRGFRLSADGKKLLVRKAKNLYVLDAKPDQKLGKAMPKAGMRNTVDPRSEWRQIFTDAWRIERDYFYDPNMHGVDWPAIRKQYEVMLEDCVSRRDVAFVIGEMISELNVGHAYVRGLGDVEKAPRVKTGMLGVDYELHDGAYRIARIYEGAAWDLDARGPLSQPGVDVHEGDYLLAVNGVPVDAAKSPWAAMQGLADRIVTLTVSDKPASDDTARDVVVKTLSSERNLRYRAWIERNRSYVAQKTDGRVGYVYVPNTGRNGQNDLFRQFFGQRDKQALIIDERWNAGGQIPTRFIELLNRPATNYWAVRNGKDWTWPPDSQQGPKCMLINGLAGSGGDCFPYYFKHLGIGKLVGMRTWGGLVGISGNPTLIDGGRISAPTFAFYETDGTWGVEGHGVDPDIPVLDDPTLMVDGGDPQLDAAIEHMLSELKRHPYTPPKRPAYPDRSGMGIREQDK